MASDAGAVEYGGELGRSEYRYAKNAAVKPERLDLPKTLLVDGASVRSKTTRFPVLLDAARNGALLGEFTHVSTSCAETASLGPGFATTVEGTTLAFRRRKTGRRLSERVGAGTRGAAWAAGSLEVADLTCKGKEFDADILELLGLNAVDAAAWIAPRTAA